MFRLTCIFLTGIVHSLFFVIVCAQSPSERTASISGGVTVGEKPAANAVVILTEVNPKKTGIIQSNGRVLVDRHSYKATTNADGSYHFTGLPAGEYKVTALSDAYVPVSRARGEDSSIKLTIDDGEARENVDIALVRGGVVTGRVTDDENRPQIGRHVSLFELSANGHKLGVHKQQGNMFLTDDRGVYRIYGLRPGRYIVKAGGRNEHIFARYRAKDFEPTYHPNTTNEEQAKIIEVTEGSEVTGVDIKLIGGGKTYEVLGRVVEAETGRPVPQIRVACIAGGSWVTDAITDSQGKFRMTGLRPGKYKVILSRSYDNPHLYTEDRYFEIETANTTGIEVTAKRGGTISGVVVLEDSKYRSLESKLYQSIVRLHIRRAAFSGQNRYFQNMDVYNSYTKPDGSFQFTGIPPRNVTFELSSMLSSVYLLRIERDGVPQPDGIDMGEAENVSGVRLIVGYGDGAIRGEVKILGGALPEGCTLHAWAHRADSINANRGERVDAKGRFLIENMLPGEYSLQMSYSCPPEIASSQLSKLLQQVTQNVSVTGGAETRATITLDFNRRDQ
jgi:hypothetical protein